MNNKIDAISQTLIRISSLSVDFVCMLNFKNTGVYNLLYDDGKGTTRECLKHSTCVLLKIIQKEWTPEQAISITSKNIYQLLSGLRYMINICRNSTNIYHYDENKININIYPKIMEEHTLKITLVGDTIPRILIHPSVKNINGKDYEAVRLYVNRFTIFVDLTLDELDSLYYTLNKIDFFTYGMSNLQYHVSTIDKIIVEPTLRRKSKKNIFYDDK